MKDEKTTESITATIPEGATTLSAAGIEDGELFIRQVQPGSIAEQRGLKAGDKMISLNEKPLTSWFAFRKQIQENGGEKLVVGIMRDQKPLNIELIPREVEHKDEVTREKKKVRQLGVISCAVPSEPATRVERHLNPFKAIQRGILETWEISVTTITGLVKLVSGKLSMNALGGPISIFYLAGTSYKMGGWASYIRIMAILSITLAIMNFLPIPILDGGHLLFYFIEAIKGSPVHIRVQHIAQQVGLILIISLMALTFYVDINRYFVERIKALFNG
jgi:regulator of sigma E protease